MIIFDCSYSAPIYDISAMRAELTKFSEIQYSGYSLVGSGWSTIAQVKFDTDEQATMFLLEYGSVFNARRSSATEFKAGIRNMYIGG